MEDELKNDFLPSFTKALAIAGVERSTIRSFQAYWNALPAGAEKRPCPLCYARGQQGWLHAIACDYCGAHLQCERCRSSFHS